MHNLLTDLRVALRGLRQARGFTATAVLALAIGIGVNNTFFTLVNAICLRGPIDDPAGLVYVGTRQATGAESGVSFRDFEDLRDATGTFIGMAAYAAAPAALGDDERAAERITVAYVTADAFTLLEESPVLGRGLAPTDVRPGAAPVVILAYHLWSNRYGADSRVAGRTVRINGTPATVIGVMREGFRFPNDAGAWLPLSAMPGVTEQPRSARTLGVFGRLRDRTTTAQAEDEIGALLARLADTYPETNRGVRALIAPINDRFTSRITDPNWIAFIVAGSLVLLIACANVANLLLARAIRRSGEMAVRASLGASRLRVIRQLLVESAALAALGGAVGLALSFAGVQLLAAAIPEGALPSWMAFTIDYRVLGMLVATCLGTVFVFGLVPALYASKVDAARVLHERGSSGTARREAGRWTTGFLAAEFGLTFVLMAILATDWRSFDALQQTRQVIDPTGVTTASLTLPPQRYPTAERRVLFYQRLLDEVQGTGAASATIASALPLGPTMERRVLLDGAAPDPGQPLPPVRVVAVGPDYFTTIGATLVAGRELTRLDGTAGQSAVVINERFARAQFPGEDPIGRRLQLIADTPAPPADQWLTIVGVAPTINQGGGDPPPIAYVPIQTMAPATLAVLVKADEDAAATGSLREIVRRLDPDLPLSRVLPMEQALADAGWNGRVASTLVHVIATVALLLAVIGLYGVTSYAVTQRTREIGVRVAVGARPADVMRLVTRRAAVQILFGVAAGVACTFAWNRLLSAGTDGVQITDPLSLSGVAALVVIVGMVASMIPARRATRLDPVAALRSE